MMTIGVLRRTDVTAEVRGPDGNWLATFTDDAYTVVLAGPRRRFAEGTASVSHARWVRTYPKPFAGRLDRPWLERALAANQARVPDVLALAMQYIRGAPASRKAACRLPAMPATGRGRRPTGRRVPTSTTISA